MLKLAVEAQLPLVAVTTRDTMNLNEILKEITKKTAIPWTPVAASAKGQLYMHVHDEKMKLPLTKLYEQMVKFGSTLVLVNMPAVVEPMFDAGEVPVPRTLMMRFMKAVVENDKAAEELLRGLGGCTIKEAAELARLTMARDKSLTVQGLMLTRKSSFQASKGLTQVDLSQGFYAPPADLQDWVKAEKAFFLTGTDHRLMPRGLLMDGPPGCIAEGTLIGVRRGKRNGHRKLPVEVLYEKFNGLYEGRDPWRKELLSFTQSWHAESGAVVYNRIEGIYDKGLKQCLRLVTESAGEVVLTPDHPVLREDGLFVRADSLSNGSSLLVRSSMLPEGEGRQVRLPRIVVEGLKYYAGGWYKDVWDRTIDRVYTYKRQHRARLVVEAHLNGLSYEAFLDALKTDHEKVATITLLPDSVDVHHIDENPLNDTLTNLQVLERSQHFLLHNDEPWRRFKVDYTTVAKVIGIEDAGLRRTFDISMGEPAANFVVNNGIVVHNTGKTAASKWIAEQLGVPLYRVDIGGTKNKYVGTSEQNMLTNLARLDHEEPCVALLDEIEKVFSTSNHDSSGTTSTMLSQLLWWLAERRSRVLVVMTTNKASSLPKELYREGRIDKVMVFNGLTHADAGSFVKQVFGTFKGLKFDLEAASKVILDDVYGTNWSKNQQTTVSQASLTKAVYTYVKMAK